MAQPDEKDAHHTITKLTMAANHYTRSSPAAARFYMSEMNKTRAALGRGPADAEQVTCPFCSAIFRPGNHKVTLRPKMKVTKRIERLRRKREAGELLEPTELKTLEQYESSRNRLVLHCESCGQDDTLYGGSRYESVRVDIRSDKLRKKQREAHKQISQQSSTKSTVPKMTAALKKRLKKREKRRERSSNDSGLPESLMTSVSRVTSVSRTDSLSLSTISTVDALTLPRSSKGASHLSSPITSTPKITQRSRAMENLPTPSDHSALFLSPDKASSGAKANKNKANKSKKKGGMGKLQGLLAQQKEQEGNMKGENTLRSFLSSV